MAIHGDDFTALGPREGLLAYEQALAKVFDYKLKGRIGEAPESDSEVRVLNRIVFIDENGITYEADPRHAEMSILAASLTLGNSSVTPGAKSTDPGIDAALEEQALDQVRFGDLDGEFDQHDLEHVASVATQPGKSSGYTTMKHGDSKPAVGPPRSATMKSQECKGVRFQEKIQVKRV